LGVASASYRKVWEESLGGNFGRQFWEESLGGNLGGNFGREARELLVASASYSASYRKFGRA
jgi:hypothetical protein